MSGGGRAGAVANRYLPHPETPDVRVRTLSLTLFVQNKMQILTFDESNNSNFD
jgi:hypothetical protein